MPNCDLLIYRSFDTGDVTLSVGDSAQGNLGSGFHGLYVVAVGNTRPMPELVPGS